MSPPISTVSCIAGQSVSTEKLGETTMVIYLPGLVCTSLTGEDSLLEVVDTISELKDQWQALGLALKLDPSVVKEISGTTPKDCLTKVVTPWLRCDIRLHLHGKDWWTASLLVCGETTHP